MQLVRSVPIVSCQKPLVWLFRGLVGPDCQTRDWGHKCRCSLCCRVARSPSSCYIFKPIPRMSLMWMLIFPDPRSLDRRNFRFPLLMCALHNMWSELVLTVRLPSLLGLPPHLSTIPHRSRHLFLAADAVLIGAHGFPVMLFPLPPHLRRNIRVFYANIFAFYKYCVWATTYQTRPLSSWSHDQVVPFHFLACMALPNAWRWRKMNEVFVVVPYQHQYASGRTLSAGAQRRSSSLE